MRYETGRDDAIGVPAAATQISIAAELLIGYHRVRNLGQWSARVRSEGCKTALTVGPPLGVWPKSFHTISKVCVSGAGTPVTNVDDEHKYACGVQTRHARSSRYMVGTVGVMIWKLMIE